MAKDPICGMSVDEKTAQHKSEHEGQTYYFCAPGCKRTFDANPAQHAKKGLEPMEHQHHGSSGQPPNHLDFIVAEISQTEAMIRYDCPCGCKPNTEYAKDSAESDYEHCCCGNVHFVGPNARADLDAYLADRKTRGEDDDVGGYQIHEESVAAPWGGTIPVVYGLPHEARKH